MQIRSMSVTKTTVKVSFESYQMSLPCLQDIRKSTLCYYFKPIEYSWPWWVKYKKQIYLKDSKLFTMIMEHIAIKG